MTEELLVVSGSMKNRKGKFIAKAVARDGKIISAAPFLKHSVGRPSLWLEQYAQLQKWSVEKRPVE